MTLSVITSIVLGSITINASDIEQLLPAVEDAFTVDQPAGTELMRVNGDGNVGINTTAPTNKLDVNGAARVRDLTGATASNNIMVVDDTGVLRESGSTLSSLLSGADTTTDAWVDNSTDERVELGTLSDGVTARPEGATVLFDDNGNLGLGGAIPTPGTIIKIKAIGNLWPLWVTSPSGTFGGFYQPSETGVEKGMWLYLRDDESYKVKISPSSTSFLNGGSLAIGQKIATEKLDVNGKIRSRDMEGAGNAFACVNPEGVLYRSATACN